MKQVLIHWHRCDPYEKKQQRKAAIRNAQRKIRQQTKLQLKKYSGNLDTINYIDDFVQPTVRLGYFD